jgi:putative flavoprotein involved in K+ transport
MLQKIETVIIGGGQAGLATSYLLSQQGKENIVLEQSARAGNAWRNDRWDSFTLLTPNWSFRLPGAEYKGDNPDGFMAREEIVANFEKYVQNFNLPVQYNVQVNSVQQNEKVDGYLVKSRDTIWDAHNVVIATGLFQRPRLPTFSADLSSRILQVHSGEYRNPQSLPAGAVLVVGSAQSGCQIAEELYLSGRKVFLCVSSAGRVPRRYRGKDIYEWMLLIGLLDRTVERLPSPAARFGSNPHVTGKDGGRTLNLHQFARDGVVLLGHLKDGHENNIRLFNDLKENLAKGDKFETDLVKQIDEYVVMNDLNVPPEKLPVLRDGYEMDEITELDLNAAGITSIIWAMGYSFDFSLVKLPVFDSDGYPVQKRGVTDYPGLFFVGLPWIYKYKSGHLVGFGEDAKYIVSEIAARKS